MQAASKEIRDCWFSEISKLLTEQQNNIKGRVTPVDFSLESYTISSFVVGVQIGDFVTMICKENNWPHFHLEALIALDHMDFLCVFVCV